MGIRNRSQCSRYFRSIGAVGQGIKQGEKVVVSRRIDPLCAEGGLWATMISEGEQSTWLGSAMRPLPGPKASKE